MLRNIPLRFILIGIGMVSAFAMPVEIFHAGVWIVVHLYMLLEFLLHELIHHLFQTSRHTTQIIVFYLMVALFSILTYVALRRLRSYFLQVKNALLGPTAPKKTKIIATLSIGSASLALLMLN